jgi:DNA-binding response OmpR family regulator
VLTLAKILIIEDEPQMLSGLKDNYTYEGYEVFVARDGEEGLKRAFEILPNLILLDVMLPRMSGLDVCRQLRRKCLGAPIIMLTARSQEIDKIVGLEIGADDYVTKPFSIQELLARTRALIRRASARVTTCQFADVEIDFRCYQAKKRGIAIELSVREFEILKYLVMHEGEVVTRDELLDKVWGYSNYPVTRTVDNHIAKLRQKLENTAAKPRHILTIHRAGYKFIA